VALTVLNIVRQCNIPINGDYATFPRDILTRVQSSKFGPSGSYGSLPGAVKKIDYVDRFGHEIKGTEDKTLAQRIEMIFERYEHIQKFIGDELGESYLHGALSMMEAAEDIGGGIWGTPGSAVNSGGNIVMDGFFT